MKPFTEEMRYEYPLTMSSLVWDIGGYKGDFSRNIIQRYGCTVMCFEPIYQFQQIIRNQNIPLILIPCALGSSTRLDTFHIKGDMTGKFAEGEPETVAVLDVVDLSFDTYVDLLKLNCEGMEFEILEAILCRNIQNQFANIQVQFHGVVDRAVDRRIEIRHKLSKTHMLTYDVPFVWENWQRHDDRV